MKILLDTAPLLWLASAPDRLSDTASRLILDPDNKLFLSAVSAWEIAVKASLGKLLLPDRVDRFVPEIREFYAIESLSLDEESTFQVGRLPDLHRDPFDRMLLCQAIVHALSVLTPDEVMHRYPVRTIW